MTQLAENIEVEGDEQAPQLPPSSLQYRAIRGAGWTLVWLGALTLGFVAHQLWITTLFAKANQADLAVELEEHFAVAEVVEIPYVPVVPPGEDRPPAPQPSISAGASGVPGVLKAETPPEEGSAFAEIRIPALESLADGWTVVEGVRLSDLKTEPATCRGLRCPVSPATASYRGIARPMASRSTTWISSLWGTRSRWRRHSASTCTW